MLQGTLIWKLEVAPFCSCAPGITVDNYGFVYVAGFDSNNVVLISPDGIKHRVLLSERDSIKRTQTLFFDRKCNKLLISNETKLAFLYDVSN